jgi:hypothetical protein
VYDAGILGGLEKVLEARKSQLPFIESTKCDAQAPPNATRAHYLLAASRGLADHLLQGGVGSVQW